MGSKQQQRPASSGESSQCWFNLSGPTSGAAVSEHGSELLWFSISRTWSVWYSTAVWLLIHIFQLLFWQMIDKCHAKAVSQNVDNRSEEISDRYTKHLYEFYLLLYTELSDVRWRSSILTSAIRQPVEGQRWFLKLQWLIKWRRWSLFLFRGFLPLLQWSTSRSHCVQNKADELWILSRELHRMCYFLFNKLRDNKKVMIATYAMIKK